MLSYLNCLTYVYPVHRAPCGTARGCAALRLRGRGESALLCAPLAVGRGGGARHSFATSQIPDTLHVARASFFVGLGAWGVSVNAAEATKGTRASPSAFLDSTQNVSDRAPRAVLASTGPFYHTGEDPCAVKLTPERPATRQRHPVCGETRDSTHDTSTTVPSRRVPPSACVHTPVLSIAPVKDACEVRLCRLGVRAIYNAPQARGCAGGSDAPGETRYRRSHVASRL